MIDIVLTLGHREMDLSVFHLLSCYNSSVYDKMVWPAKSKIFTV
jgi:hypothetical protein